MSDLNTLALTIYGEARGEPIEGQIAVACVIRNRVNGRSYEVICFTPKQFSCWNENDPNRALLDSINQKLINGDVIDIRMFDQCLWIAHGIINNSIIDRVHGAKNYLTKELFDNNRPDWATKATNTQVIGNQVFFNV